MKVSWATVLAFVWLAPTCLVADDESEQNRVAPQCTSMDADGTCLDESVPQQGGGDDDNGEEVSPYPPTCGLYMAKSSIPNAGWGMYANRDIERGEEIVPLDMVVQVYDAPRRVREGRRSWLLSEYVWNSGECSVIRTLFQTRLY